MSDWCTIESDPGVFTSLIESFGVKNAQLAELWSMDDDSLSNLVNEYGKVYGLIFLFKWQSNASSGDEESSAKPLSMSDTPEDLFFARQVVTNACATQAILSILLNAPCEAASEGEVKGEDETGKLFLGTTLEAFKSFTATFPPDIKGEVIGANDEIRSAHNSFARRESFLVENTQKRIAGDDDDVFHFIAYVPHDNNQRVYELDGLQSGPILSGEVEKTSEDGSTDDLAWLQVARSAIQKRIEKYAATEIKFNLMALTADKRVRIESQMKSLAASDITEGDESIAHLQAELASEEEKRQQWKEENERRRHNYLPFCMELIKALAGSGKLPEFTEKANERMVELRKKKMIKKEMMGSK